MMADELKVTIMTKTHAKTRTKTMTKTKLLKDPTSVIFSKMISLKDTMLMADELKVMTMAKTHAKTK